MAPRKVRRRKRSPLVAVLVVTLLIVAGVAAFRAFFTDESATAPAPPPPRAAPASPAPPPAGALPTQAPAPFPSAPVATASPAAASPGPSPTAAAAAPSRAPGAARLAIIIDDCGQWPVTERAFIALPFPLTLSVLPHVRYGAEIAAAANAAGKGVMLHLPMETVSGRDPGPGTVTTAMDDGAIQSLVAADLADVPLARGVNNHEGSRATADARVMNDVASALAKDGRFFVDSRTSAKTVAETVARAHGIPAGRRNVFLDDVDDVVAIEAQLRQAAGIARSSGSAIAIGHPRRATLEAVRALGPGFEASGVTLVLAADVVR